MPQLSKEIGYVTRSNDYLIYIEGLPSVAVNDIIITRNGSAAIVEGLNGEIIRALMLNNYRPKPGEIFETYAGLRLPLPSHLYGRAINPLGIPIDGKEALPFGPERLVLEKAAPKVNERAIIDEQLYTGFTIVDSILPIGKGQRELFMGDARSGKSSFALDIILAQKNQDVTCIYAALGKPETAIKRSVYRLFEVGAAPYTIVIGASSNEPAPLIAIAPDVALTIAENIMQKGKNVLVVLDDVGLHAKYLREIALLSQEIPGRESYPGDIFYAHSRIMERSGKFKKESGNFSITLLPVIETELDNTTSLIPTNLMSQTDGHLLFSSTLSAQGRYPSIDWSRSVTRVGRQVQDHLQKLVSSKIRHLLAAYQNLKSFSRFETEIASEAQLILRRAEMVETLLNQELGGNIEKPVQTILLALPFTKVFEQVEPSLLREKKFQIIEKIKNNEKLITISRARHGNFDDFVTALESQIEGLEDLY